jgi:DnaJ-class molecular chaperone
MRVSGEGQTGSGRPGDLFLRIQVRPHARFGRQEDDLTTTAHIPLTTAVLGGELDVTTLEGRHVDVKVPAGTPPGRVLRIKGQGLPRSKNGDSRGDLLVSLALEVPTSLSARERELFEELKRLGR